MTVVPKKHLGQHFLVDENILGVIERLAELAPDDVVLEVGPGLGVLTRFLADRVAYVHAVEIDRSLESGLRGLPHTDVHWGDALALDLAAFEPPARKLVANLPYNIATPLVVESLDRLPAVETWCVMVQREVADSQPSGPGSTASRERCSGRARTSSRRSWRSAAPRPGSLLESSASSRARSPTAERHSRTHSRSPASPRARKPRPH